MKTIWTLACAVAFTTGSVSQSVFAGDEGMTECQQPAYSYPIPYGMPPYLPAWGSVAPLQPVYGENMTFAPAPFAMSREDMQSRMDAMKAWHQQQQEAMQKAFASQRQTIEQMAQQHHEMMQRFMPQRPDMPAYETATQDERVAKAEAAREKRAQEVQEHREEMVRKMEAQREAAKARHADYRSSIQEETPAERM